MRKLIRDFPTPANNFGDAFRALSDILEDPASFERYYVERPDSPVELLKQRLEWSGPKCHILLTGQEKSGKTTELLRLIRDIKDTHFPVFISVLKDMEPSDVQPIDLLLLAATKLCDEAIKAKVKIGDKLQKDLSDWLLQNSTEVFQTQIKEKTKSAGIRARLKAVLVGIEGNYGIDTALRSEIRTKLEPRVGELTERIDMLVEKIRQDTGKQPVVIIDDIEKTDLDKQERIFLNHAATLTRPSCQIIYTVSRAIEYKPYWNIIRNSFPEPVDLPSIRTTERDGKDFESGLTLLREIITKRVSVDLFEEEALGKIIKCCNGVLGDLLSVVRGCCLLSAGEGKNKITWEMVDRQFQILTDNFRRMISEEFYQKLVEIYQNKMASRDEIIVELLAMQAVIEYRDEQGIYYDVHPAVVPLLKQKGLLRT